MILHIDVANKVATCRKRDGNIVCGNSDYQIKFSFDSEWNAYPKKTARFIRGGQFDDVEFTGDTCTVPIITNTDRVEVGVYAGNLKTTTSAVIGCTRSVLCQEATPSVENDKAYANEAKEAADRAEAAALKVDKAGNGIKAVVTAAEMDAILANATPENVGSFYMYLGETTDSYRKGAVYRIGEV